MGNGVLGQRIKKSSILDKTQEVLMKKKTFSYLFPCNQPLCQKVVQFLKYIIKKTKQRFHFLLPVILFRLEQLKTLFLHIATFKIAPVHTSTKGSCTTDIIMITSLF